MDKLIPFVFRNQYLQYPNPNPIKCFYFASLRPLKFKKSTGLPSDTCSETPSLLWGQFSMELLADRIPPRNEGTSSSLSRHQDFGSGWRQVQENASNKFVQDENCLVSF